MLLSLSAKQGHCIMFSANENIQLRQHKRRIAQAVEATMEEEVLDLGVNVMVMQVKCTDPGCVPIETVIVIIFPASDTEVIPGFSQSAGGSYKTKILKPMSEVEIPDDVLDALPPAFEGGRRTVERLAIQLRDVVLAQVTQLGGDDVALRAQLAGLLQTDLDAYVQHECIPPPIEGEYSSASPKDEVENSSGDNGNAAVSESTVTAPRIPPTTDDTSATTSIALGDAMAAAIQRATTSSPSNNSSSFVPQRILPSQRFSLAATTRPSRLSSFDSVSRRRQQAAATRNLLMSSSSNNNNLLHNRRGQRHATRIMGCPCCETDDSTSIDQMMQL